MRYLNGLRPLSWKRCQSGRKGHAIVSTPPKNDSVGVGVTRVAASIAYEFWGYIHYFGCGRYRFRVRIQA